MRPPGARMLVRRREGPGASPRHLLHVGENLAPDEAEQQRGSSRTQPRPQGRESFSRAADLVLPAQATQASGPPPPTTRKDRDAPWAEKKERCRGRVIAAAGQGPEQR